MVDLDHGSLPLVTGDVNNVLGCTNQEHVLTSA